MHTHYRAQGETGQFFESDFNLKSSPSRSIKNPTKPKKPQSWVKKTLTLGQASMQSSDEDILPVSTVSATKHHAQRLCTKSCFFHLKI